MNFSGKAVLITGASSGIGATTAEHFAKLGANVAIVGRNEEKLQTVLKKCQELNKKGKCISIKADVTTDAKNIVTTTTKAFKRIDVLVNNAGVGAYGSIEEATMEQFETIMNTNLRAVFEITKLAVPYLLESKGNIINVSSVAGLRSFTGALVYCMSKAALDQFTHCTALDLAPKGVRVNSVNPAVIVTEFHKRLGMNDDAYQKYLEHCKTSHALGRVGEPSEVASAITFLASDAASFITGTCLPVDGGKTVMCPRKVALVTDASSGIGAATAEHFAKLGANVALVGRNEDNLLKVLKSCQELNKKGKCISIKADVTTDAERIVSTTEEQLKGIDILVNNAGIGGLGSILDTDLDQFDKVMNTNLRAVFEITKLAAPYLIKSKGNIVNVSSIAGLRSFPGFVVYGMSKAALDQFTKCTALDLAPQGVRVNSVNPGVIPTNFHIPLGINDEVYQKYLEHAKSTNPLGRVGEASDVASAIAFLASGEAGFTTRTCLAVDGGIHATCPR